MTTPPPQRGRMPSDHQHGPMKLRELVRSMKAAPLAAAELDPPPAALPAEPDPETVPPDEPCPGASAATTETEDDDQWP